MNPNLNIKKKLELNLSDVKYTAKICRALSSETRLEILRCLIQNSMTISQLAEMFYLPMSSMCMHINILQEANLITVVPMPGIRGNRKLCSLTTASMQIDFFSHLYQKTQQSDFYVHMPIGNYSNCRVTSPCGIVSKDGYIFEEDSPHGFFVPEHTNASLLWFISGMLEYHFPNDALLKADVSRITFSFEICSEAPGYNPHWPSDIEFILNQHLVTTLHTDGDYGGRRGINNPSWWKDTSTQFGELKVISITHDGCYLNDTKVSEETIESLGLLNDYSFSMIFNVDSPTKHTGGMNLFGKHFGDYAQDIVMKVEYQ